ncbi:hypothetical protein [Bowmanella dokdonensis]|uniref:Uncharacterized protein n=1 Tax=Bowmanella dokdonensis TaxID=751969 RepID=A0A939INF3_9ALTE|nr:hypothetical protein [Bowmanella dokdonensis]MBN7824760.1 hypothetical protein [Bowmanella dokdonensis]
MNLNRTEYLMVWPVGQTLAKLILRRVSGSYSARAKTLLIPARVAVGALAAAVTPDAGDLALALNRTNDPQLRVSTNKLHCAKVVIHTRTWFPTASAQPAAAVCPSQSIAQAMPKPSVARGYLSACVRPVCQLLTSLRRTGQTVTGKKPIKIYP